MVRLEDIEAGWDQLRTICLRPTAVCGVSPCYPEMVNAAGSWLGGFTIGQGIKDQRFVSRRNG